MLLRTSGGALRSGESVALVRVLTDVSVRQGNGEDVAAYVVLNKEADPPVSRMPQDLTLGVLLGRRGLSVIVQCVPGRTMRIAVVLELKCVEDEEFMEAGRRKGAGVASFVPSSIERREAHGPTVTCQSQ